jgi:hypothetical protein
MKKIKKPTTSKLITFIVAIIILGIVIFVSSTFKDMDKKIKVQHIEIQDKAKSVDNLKNKLEKINSELKDTKSSDSESKKRVEQLEKEKQELQSQLQARKEQKEKLARAAEISQQASAKSVPAQVPAKSVTAQAPVRPVSSNKQDLMAQAGIPQSDWSYVDSIISRESGWRHTIWNSTGSGAYGLCQALPGAKMASAGADWQTNPVTQLRWCHGYAIGRYKSWAAAHSFWNANHWW